MAGRRDKPKDIVSKLRQIEVLQGQGKPIADAVRHIGVTVRFRDEFLNGEVFYSLREAQILIENWRGHYNTVRPHSSLGYRPPAPESIIPMDQRSIMH